MIQCGGEQCRTNADGAADGISKEASQHRKPADVTVPTMAALTAGGCNLVPGPSCRETECQGSR